MSRNLVCTIAVMARPQTKDELIAASDAQLDKLMDLLGSLPPADREADFPPAFTGRGPEAHWQRDKNCKDVVIHLYEWQRLWLSWVTANMDGRSQPFLPRPYTWSSYAGMNEELRDQHLSTSYSEAVELLRASHGDVMARLQTLSNEELFTKKYFSFTGSTSLGSYAASATSSHYEWAIKKIRQYKRSL